MSVASFCATSWTKRASWRDGESFSPPTDWRTDACAGVSVGGTPSANSRTVCRLRVPSSAVLLPMMSLENIPWMSVPASLNDCARNAEPNRPCSSPATAAKTTVASIGRVANTRAISRIVATPDASSSAPGASLVKFMMSVTRES